MRSLIGSSKMWALLVWLVLLATGSWAAPNPYSITFRAADPTLYDRLLPNQVSCPGTGRAGSPLSGANWTSSVSSLAPQTLALGQVVAYEVKVSADGSTSGDAGKISFTAGWDGQTASSLGFDTTNKVICAFVDTSDSSTKDPSATARVASYSSVLSGSEIQGTFQLEGLDDGDSLIVQIWVSLPETFPPASTGTIQSRIVSAQSGAGNTINSGNQTVPMSKPQEFFTKKASLTVSKQDSPDPVYRLAQPDPSNLLGVITYTLEVKNTSGDVVSNLVGLEDTLDSNTAFISLSVTDEAGSATSCMHDGSTAGGTITCDFGFLNPLETVQLVVRARVLSTASYGTGGLGPCSASSPLCNRAAISALNDEDETDNQVSQPTGVTAPGSYGDLIIDKVPNADVVYTGTLVTYAYSLTNPGSYPVTAISVSDDKCSPVSYQSGDANGNGMLDPSEEWSYQCQAILTEDTRNIGSVSAVDYITGLSLEDANDAIVRVIDPGIALTKSASSSTVLTGGAVTYTYRVSNTGDDPLDQVGVDDDKCSPVTYVSGDTNSDNALDPSEMWEFTCSSVLVADTTNTAVARGYDSLAMIWKSAPQSVTVTIDDCPADSEKTSGGACGCGIADTDSDTDGTPDCLDECDSDAEKTSPGACGCGVMDTDNDGDGTANCLDGCPDDPDKLSSGICGCGTSEIDTDDDGSPDCTDGCSSDPDKSRPGACGCGTADTDSDADGTPNCLDGCPDDPDKLSSGICGCGTPDTDSDGDGTADCSDACPGDGDKVAPGACGCGVSDGDTDGDGTADCSDVCPSDPNKTLAGTCGCGAADDDADDDGTADCVDACPSDPLKSEPGICGCDAADTDGDSDGTADCLDLCPSDGAKIGPGICGCGVLESDGDGDGTADCLDGCPLDAGKVSPGICGCGTPDADTDSDGTPDCRDECSTDPDKIGAGACGCGVADLDSDGDGTFNCSDACPSDPDKIEAGACGCGISDADRDADRTPDCDDGCPSDAFKSVPGICGCGIADTDGDGDGTADCLDLCPADSSKSVPGLCGCGAVDTDSDDDGTPDCNDGCPSDPVKQSAGACGCGVDDVDSDEDGVSNCSDPCPDDSSKVTPGLCGCGVADTDSDSDGTADCSDACPADPNKSASGICGCGASDADSDGDGKADCVDACPADPAKREAGVCGCGTPDTDSDADGTPDCLDGCPTDTSKVAPGACGCGAADADSDGDGTQDCKDECPNDADKTQPGVCGCGGKDVDTDNDGGLDCVDACPLDPAKLSPGVCGCSMTDSDSDSDGTANCLDECPLDGGKTSPGACGCGTKDVDGNGNGLMDCVEPPDCRGVPGGTAVADSCGICGGDSQSCITPRSCVEERSDVITLASVNKVVKAAVKLEQRTEMFAAKGEVCGGKRYSNVAAVKKARLLVARIRSLLSSNISRTQVVCSDSVCSRVSTSSTKVSLNGVTSVLYKVQKQAKLRAIAACKPKKDERDNRKRTEDYRDDLLDAIKKLPGSRLNC